MFCIKCNKMYLKKSYFDKHISKGDCLKTSINVFEKKNEPKKLKQHQEEILDKDIDEIITRIFKKNEDADFIDVKKQVEFLVNEINMLRDRVKILEGEVLHKIDMNIIENKSMDEIKIFRKERMNIDDKIVMEHLKIRSLDSDCNLLYKYYFDNVKKNMYPLKKIKKMDVMYWNGNDWVEDINGTYTKSVFIHNLRKNYSKVNTINSSKDGEYIANQEYINELTDSNKKYQQLLYEYFMETYL